MSLSIVVNGGGTFTASMEEGPVSFTASLGAVPGPKGDTGATGPAGVVAATAPILYNSGTQTVSIDSTPTFESVDVTDGVNTSGIYPDSIVFNDADVLTETSLVLNDGTNELSLNTTGITFPDATLQSTAFVGEARKVYITARNNTGTTIAKGKVVRLSGATGNHPTIALAQANTEGNSSHTIGITVEAIANNADGKVIISGAAENIDTSDFNAGDTVHLSSSVAGGLQLALPVAPLHGVVVGIVTRANPSVGSIEVAINNYQELGELSDILLASKANNDLLAWDSTASVWKNRTFSTLGLLTSATAASTYAPIASPTFTGTVTIPAGASISGFAPIASPTFSGAPSLPTGTIAVTQTAGNNTTAVATTAFVQTSNPAASTTVAGHVELATDAEAVAGTSATLAVTPSGLRAMMNAFAVHDNTSSGSANGGTTNTNIWDTMSFSTSATLANSNARRYSSTQSAAVLPWAYPGHPAYKLDFSKVVAVRWTVGTSGGTGRVFIENDGWFGCFIAQNQSTTAITGGIVQNIGFGWKLDAAGTITVSARNASGTTSATFASGFDIVNLRTTTNNTPAYEVYQYSDGAGNLYTYVDGVLKSTITAAPTTMSDVASSPFAVWGIHIDNGTSTPTGSTNFTSSFPRLYIGK